jgi:peptidoglycan/xylan/chitin deacetylase (PgdA/CDA1 family)
MRVPGLKRLEQGARWMRSRFVSGALILGYHRIAATSRDPYSMCVSPQRFSEQLKILRQHATPMRLQDVVQRMQDDNLPSRAVALTFDDGYKDQLFEAKPLLEKHQIPATVFVTTGYFDSEFWWNELEEILISPVNLPQHLSILINGERFNWSCVTRDHSNRIDDSRRNLLLSLYQRMLLIPRQHQQNLLNHLRKWTGAISFQRPSRALTCEQVVQLASGNLIDIGAHSVSHPFLNRLSAASQHSEIHESKASLEKLLGQPISGFSYPNGAASERTRDMVREAGFVFACASYNDVAWRRSNRFYLPRFWIGDWDAQTFSRWLHRWLCSPTAG